MKSKEEEPIRKGCACSLLFEIRRKLNLKAIPYDLVFKGELSFSRCVVSAGDLWVDGETGCRKFRVGGIACAPLTVKGRQ